MVRVRVVEIQMIRSLKISRVKIEVLVVGERSRGVLEEEIVWIERREVRIGRRRYRSLPRRKRRRLHDFFGGLILLLSFALFPKHA